MEDHRVQNQDAREVGSSKVPFSFDHTMAFSLPRAWDRVPQSPFAKRHRGRKVWKRIQPRSKKLDDLEPPHDDETRGIKRQKHLIDTPVMLRGRQRFIATAREQALETPRRKMAKRKSLRKLMNEEEETREEIQEERQEKVREEGSPPGRESSKAEDFEAPPSSPTSNFIAATWSSVDSIIPSNGNHGSESINESESEPEGEKVHSIDQVSCAVESYKEFENPTFGKMTTLATSTGIPADDQISENVGQNLALEIYARSHEVVAEVPILDSITLSQNEDDHFTAVSRDPCPTDSNVPVISEYHESSISSMPQEYLGADLSTSDPRTVSIGTPLSDDELPGSDSFSSGSTIRIEVVDSNGKMQLPGYDVFIGDASTSNSTSDHNSASTAEHLTSPSNRVPLEDQKSSQQADPSADHELSSSVSISAKITRSSLRYSDDTHMLQEFLHRAQARKAARSQMPHDGDTAHQSSRRSPRKVLGRLDHNSASLSPSPTRSPAASKALSQSSGNSLKDISPSLDDHITQDQIIHPHQRAPTRRSTRIRPTTVLAKVSLVSAPSLIPVRRTEGETVLPRPLAPVLGQITRTNTRRNLGRAMVPRLRLVALAIEETHETTTTVITADGGKSRGGAKAGKAKRVGWDATLAYYHDDVAEESIVPGRLTEPLGREKLEAFAKENEEKPQENAEKPKEMREKDQEHDHQDGRLRLHRLRGLGAGQGTPARKRKASHFGLEQVMSRSTRT